MKTYTEDEALAMVAAAVREVLDALQDPLVVHLNMVAGKIAKPLPAQLVHIYGEAEITAALSRLLEAARAEALDAAYVAAGRWSIEAAEDIRAIRESRP